MAPNVPQQVDTRNGGVVVLKLDPETDAYARVAARLQDRSVYDLPDHVTNELSARAGPFLKGPAFSPARLWNLALDLVGDPPGARNRFDSRVERVLGRLKGTFKAAPSAAQLAKGVGLSEGRLIHLFTKQLGVPLRRYILWLRLRHVVYVYILTHSLTEAAYAAGFADSAHMSRTFRSLFGVSPSALLRHQENVRLVIGLPTQELSGPHASSDARSWATAAAAFPTGSVPGRAVGEPHWLTIANPLAGTR